MLKALPSSFDTWPSWSQVTVQMKRAQCSCPSKVMVVLVVNMAVHLLKATFSSLLQRKGYSVCGALKRASTGFPVQLTKPRSVKSRSQLKLKSFMTSLTVVAAVALQSAWSFNLDQGGDCGGVLLRLLHRCWGPSVFCWHYPCCTDYRRR